MILTVTCNPALDCTMVLSAPLAGGVNRAARQTIRCGGKGVNVSAMLRALGLDSTATGFSAGFTGEALEREVRRMGVFPDFVRLKTGLTRVNVKLRGEGETEVNAPGPAPDEEERSALAAKTAALGDGSKLLTMLLMLIGGSPGSTAGGIKTTTLAVLLLSAAASLLHTHETTVLGRRLEQEAVHRASSVLTVYLTMAMSATIFICMVQPHLALTDVLFEVFSAMDTVGMSTGVTRDLSSASRLVITALMYCGRVGSLTFALMFTERRRPPAVQRPVEKILVG